MYDELKKIHEEKKHEIRKRLEEFKCIRDDRELFSELTFCLCTPQSKAVECDKAVKMLSSNGLLFNGSERQIQPFLNKIRFHENKSKYIVEAREKFFKDNVFSLKEKIFSMPAEKAREWLVDNVKGFGYKEATHFLRNIGLAKDLAILDRHVLRCLVDFKVIDEIPKALTPKKYIEIEKKMKEFSEKIGISMEELDFVFFYRQTGEIFK
ncbi:MAG: N-glycosylase/DNA lyase [Candidatus Aenigmatarchaeota archaeon]|nr:N-glycosylase/DNA lyase [Candidatus Aenigmarchaeota archaeon]